VAEGVLGEVEVGGEGLSVRGFDEGGALGGVAEWGVIDMVYPAEGRWGEGLLVLGPPHPGSAVPLRHPHFGDVSTT